MPRAGPRSPIEAPFDKKSRTGRGIDSRPILGGTPTSQTQRVFDRNRANAHNARCAQPVGASAPTCVSTDIECQNGVAFRTMLGARSTFVARSYRSPRATPRPSPLCATRSRTEKEWPKSVADYYANQGQTESGRKRPRALSASAPHLLEEPRERPAQPRLQFALNRCILEWHRAREHSAGRSGREASRGKTMRGPAQVCDRSGDPNTQ